MLSIARTWSVNHAWQAVCCNCNLVEQYNWTCSRIVLQLDHVATCICSWVHVAFEAAASLTPVNFIFEAEYYIHIIFGNCISAQLLIRGNNDVSSCVISSDDWSLSIPFWSGFPFWSLALESAGLDVYYWKKVLHMTSGAIYIIT
jgi:hypothetical protein